MLKTMCGLYSVGAWTLKINTVNKQDTFEMCIYIYILKAAQKTVDYDNH